MAIKTYEKELKGKKISFKTMEGTYKSTAYDTMKDMMPTEYRGDIKLNYVFTSPDWCDSNLAITTLQDVVRMFKGDTLEVVNNQGLHVVLTLKCYTTIPVMTVGKVVIASSNSPAELAAWLRKYWCIPLDLDNYDCMHIPDSIDKLNYWLHNYGADDIKVDTSKNGLLGYTYKVDGKHPRVTGDSDMHSFGPYSNSCEEMAVWIAQERPQVVKIWDIREENTVRRNSKSMAAPAIKCRVIGRKGDMFALQDIDYFSTKCLDKEALKIALHNKKLDVINMQLDKANRLVKKHVDLKSVCRPYSNRNPLEHEEVRNILFYGLAYIYNMDLDTKKKWCMKIKKSYGMDAEDIISMFIDNHGWNEQRYNSLDTACRDKVIYLIYELAGVKN